MLEFVIKGPPIGVNAKEHSPTSRRKYREWKQNVAQTANRALPTGWQTIKADEVIVHITNYHQGGFHDVDNIIKPIFDGMNGIVFDDDKQVRYVSSQRIDVRKGIMDTRDLILDAVNKYDEFVHIIVEWEVE